MPGTKTRVAVATASFALVAAAGCLQGPAETKPTPTPKPTAAPKASPSPTATPVLTCSPAPTLPPPTTQLATKATLAWIGVDFKPGNDVVATVRNLTSQAIDISDWQLCGGNFVYGKLSKTRTSIPASADVRIHVNDAPSCAESDTEFCAEAGAAVTALEGNLAIYKSPVSFESSASIVDFVEWGTAGKPRENVADNAGIWKASVSIPVNGCQASMSVKVPGASGAENWQ